MKIKDIYESTTSGSVATVASPLGKTQSRNASIYGDKKAGNLLTGKKTNKKYANSVNESKEDRERNRLMQMATDYEEKAKKTKSDIKKDHYRKMADDIRSKIKTKDNVSEGKMKELAMDIRDMDNGNFQKKYKKSKEQMKYSLGDPDKKPVSEAHLEEDDLILVPGQGHRLKTGFHKFDPDKAEHEGETLKNSLRTIARNAKELHSRLENHDQFPEWVSEKIGTIKGMMTAVTEYLISSQEPAESAGVIAGGGVGESISESEIEDRLVNLTKKYRAKFGKTYTGKKVPPGIWDLLSAGTYIEQKIDKTLNHITARSKALANLEKDTSYYTPYLGRNSPEQLKAIRAEIHPESVEEGIKEKIKGAVRREKAMDLPLVQTRRDYAMGKAGQSYEKGETRRGNQYSAWAERDRKKKNDPTTNPAGTYRTKTSDYTNEAQSMGTALKNTLAKAEPGSKLDNSIKSHNRDIKNGGKGTLKNAPTGYHFDNKGYCRLGDTA